MKAVNIKGKDYITVNERLKHFRAEGVFTNWGIVETIVSLDDKEGVFKVTITDETGSEVVSAHV